MQFCAIVATFEPRSGDRLKKFKRDYGTGVTSYIKQLFTMVYMSRDVSRFVPRWDGQEWNFLRVSGDICSN